MAKKGKRVLWKKIKYKMDIYMGKGVGSQFAMLFIFIAIIVLGIGVLAAAVDPDISFGMGIWQSFVHVIDQGTIGGDDVSNVEYIVLMCFITIIGIVFMGTLISIIENSLDRRMTLLSKGHSQIMEKEHTVIVGCNEDVFCIIEELIISNDNEKHKKCIVVIDNKDAAEMENDVGSYLKSSNFVKEKKLKHPKKTRLIFRSGNVVQKNIYELANLPEASSVIINYDDDFKVLQVLLMVTTYLREIGRTDIHIATLLHDEKSINSAKFACSGFHNAEIMYFEKILSRIMAHVCRQPGLSLVLTEVFGYSGSEFYFEGFKDGKKVPLKFEYAGLTFKKVSMMLSNAILVGIRHKEQDKNHKYVELNPDVNTEIKADDALIVMCEDDNMLEVAPGDPMATFGRKIEYMSAEQKKPERKPSYYLILDWSESLSDIIMELDKYVAPKSHVRVVSDKEYKKFAGKLKNFDSIEFIQDENMFNEGVLENYLIDEKAKKVVTNVVLVSEDGVGKDEADARTMVQLLHLREIISKNLEKYGHINITSEMNSAEDQMLLQVANVNDFVVGSEIANRILAQVSNEPVLHELYKELLDEYGSEIYLRKAKDYVKLGIEMTFGELQAAVMFREDKECNEICLGWKKAIPDGKPVVLNPGRDAVVSFASDDQVIVISEGRGKDEIGRKMWDMLPAKH